MRKKSIFIWVLGFFCLFTTGFVQTGCSGDRPQLPGLSGLAWIADDTFLAVHDVKDGSKDPRVSTLRLPASGNELIDWKSIEWPSPQDLSIDLESVARIPDKSSLFLLVESKRRIFLAEYQEPQQLKLIESIAWPAKVENVEGTAVAKVGEHLIFIYAERAKGELETDIHWADIELEPLKIGEFRKVRLKFTESQLKGLNRPVSAMEVNNSGTLYVASSYDPGNKGPFRSVLWKVGHIQEADGKSQVVLDSTPELLATFDGFKVESVAVRQEKGLEIFVGTDDEYYGGTLRQVPLD